MNLTTLRAMLAVKLSAPRSARTEGSARPERGDVPGWVLITVMTAGLVAALWAVAGPQLSQMLTEALRSVKG